MLATMTVESATDGDVFLAFLDHVLCPKLRSGHVVVMDNLSAHKVDGVRERIEASGASVLTCRLTRLISISSKKPGPSSKPASARSPHEPCRGSNTRPHKLSRPSPHKTAWLRLRFGDYT